MTTKSGCPEGYKAVDKAAEERILGGRRGGSYWQSDGMAAESGNKLLPTAQRGRWWGKKMKMIDARIVWRKNRRRIMWCPDVSRSEE